MYQAIDQAAHKLERQAGRWRERRRRRRGAQDAGPPVAVPDLPPLELPEVDDGPRIVKSKRFDMKPMTAEDAAMQLEMLHHDFYVFTSSETGAVNVVYRRRDGDYGLIAPEL
jgi:putative sigma-54 modulation protein